MSCYNFYIGIDNGVTGSVGVISYHQEPVFFQTPVKRQLSYTKKAKWINRIDTNLLALWLMPFKKNGFVYLERPMVNPGRFDATVSALRALEATLIVVEDLEMPVTYVDSKQWQKVMLPSGLQKEQLKKASLDIGKRMFPQFKSVFTKDADGILIAEWAKRMFSGGPMNEN